MRVSFLEHVPFEGPAAVGDWAASRRAAVTRHRLYAGDALPGPSDFDLLVVMGGSMNVYEDEKHPFLGPEIDLLKLAAARGKRVLGICLGAQLLAVALGGSVYRNAQREIGWHQVRLAADARTQCAFVDFPETFTAFHWHGDTFSLPPHSVRGGSSEATLNQAFVVAEHLVGLQFHIETTAASLEELIGGCADELTEGPYVQPAPTLREGLVHAPAMHKLLNSLLDNIMA